MMNKKFCYPLFVSVAMIATGCSKMGSISDYVKADPELLESVGGKVAVKVDATFPEKYFSKKKAILKITPALVYEKGETTAEEISFQGEKATTNYEVIPYETGASVSRNIVFPYNKDMNVSDFYLRPLVISGAREYSLPPIMLAKGVIATAELASAENAMALIAPDKYQHEIEKQIEQEILFLINKSDVRSTELKEKNMSQFNADVKALNQEENKEGYTRIENLAVSSYASPDGTFDFNNNLAQQREKATKNYWKGELKKLGVSNDVNTTYTPQDWDGLKKLVEESDIADKDMILRVLSSYSEEQRMGELKNMSAVFDELATKVLPQLRRSSLVASYKVIGKTDETINEYMANSPEKLNEEEMLHAASLVKDNDFNAYWEKVGAIYKKCAEMYPESYRAVNNLGVVEYAKKNFDAAASYFKKAASMNSSCAEANANLGLIELRNGNKEKAASLIMANRNANNAGEALGTLYMAQGKVSEAVSAFGSIKSNNAGIAQIVNKDYRSAKNTLNAVEQPTALTYYSKAIVAARNNDKAGVDENLAKAKEMKPEITSCIENDWEFAKFVEGTKCK